MIQQISADILLIRAHEISPFIEKYAGSPDIPLYAYPSCKKGMQASE